MGEVGELCVRGPLVMSGYLDRPEETAKAFAGDWLHTGDMARRDADGYLYLVDRAKDMIISGGFNVYSSEVESCLAQRPAVALSAVIGVPHAKWGEAVMAVVVVKEGGRRYRGADRLRHRAQGGGAGAQARRVRRCPAADGVGQGGQEDAARQVLGGVGSAGWVAK